MLSRRIRVPKGCDGKVPPTGEKESPCSHVGSAIKVGGIPFCFRRGLFRKFYVGQFSRRNSACSDVGSVIKVGGIPFCFRRRQSWTKMKPLWRVSSAYGTPHGWADGRHFLFSKKVYAHSVHEGLCRRARLMFVGERPRGSWRLADVLAQACCAACLRSALRPL